jgi:hypothetical protein
MNSAATAITRTKVSAPTRWLVNNNYLYGLVCHFGEGKAFMDTEAMNNMQEVDGVYAYEPASADPNKQELPLGCPFEFVVANYVLNVLEPEERAEAFIQAYLKGVSAIFTVRLDSVNGTPYKDGVITQRNTFQAQLNTDEWIEFFYKTLYKNKLVSSRVRILQKTNTYLMVEVY